jgi:hypothetical protein
MNIAIDINNIDIELCVKILDKRTNNIMPGDFTKILFSNEFVSLNGVYVTCPLELKHDYISSASKSTQFHKHSTIQRKQPSQNDVARNFIYFQANHPDNVAVIRQCKVFEEQLLAYYSQYMCCIKRPVYLLHNVLSNGSFKFYRDTSDIATYEDTSQEDNVRYIIKISGIWETVDTFGITYKFLKMYD